MKLSENHQQLHSFFSGYALPQALGRLSGCIKAADSPKIWKGHSPADLLWFMDKFQELIDLVFYVTEEEDYHSGAILNDKTNGIVWQLNSYETYCGWHADSNPWDFFPRHLSRKEFINPYLALRKLTRFYSKEEWETCLKDILQHALSPHHFYELDDSVSLLRIYLLLHKMLEACHLIDVRTSPKKEYNADHSSKQTNISKEKQRNKTEYQQSPEESAWQRIKEFFDFFEKQGAAEDLWTLTKRALTAANDEIDAKDRSNMLFVYEQIKELVANIYILHQQKQLQSVLEK